MSKKEHCTICCEDTNKSNRKPIRCPHCGVETCISCIKRYLLDLYGDPNCMHCDVGWNNDFMRETFPSSWISKEYKDHREKVLFDIEKARMPDTQQYITFAIEKTKAQQKTIELGNKVKALKIAYQKTQDAYREAQYLVLRIDRFVTGRGPNPFYDTIPGSFEERTGNEREARMATELPRNETEGSSSSSFAEEKKQYITFAIEKTKAQQKTIELGNKVKALRIAYQKTQDAYKEAATELPRNETEGSSSSSSSAKEKKQFIMPCPIDGCRGFLSQSWKCGVCLEHICKDCHCKKNEEVVDKAKEGSGKEKMIHECDPDIKASIALMKRDSKRCPTCGSVIYRIEGCDQMWCTQCCNAFSWNTGRVQKGMVHNPHYFEWLRSQGGDTTRAMRDIVNCGARFIDGYIRFRPTDSQIMREAYRLLRHIDQAELPEVPSDGKRRCQSGSSHIVHGWTNDRKGIQDALAEERKGTLKKVAD